jgi:RHS repeat-associated protein
LSCDYYYIQVYVDGFDATLESYGADFDTNGVVTLTDWGQPLCDGGTSGMWLTHNYYHADGNGNITCMVAPNDTVTASYRYDPFGNTLSQSGGLASANTYRFSSKEIHAATGLYYYGYRFYAPNLQRWVNRDPAGEEGGVNLYRVSNNSPLVYFDPDGYNPGAIIGGTIGTFVEPGGGTLVGAWIGSIAGAVAIALVCTSDSPPGPPDPCDTFIKLKGQIPGNILAAASTVSLAGGPQAALNNIPGLTKEMRNLIANMYDAAAACAESKGISGAHNRERARFLRGDRPTGPGPNIPPRPPIVE